MDPRQPKYAVRTRSRATDWDGRAIENRKQDDDPTEVPEEDYDVVVFKIRFPAFSVLVTRGSTAATCSSSHRSVTTVCPRGRPDEPSSGGVRERPNRHDWKSCVGKLTVGSNPTSSASLRRRASRLANVGLSSIADAAC